METKTIVRVNNVDIVATSDEQKLVPIKPVCEALGIDAEGQRQKIESHYLLGPTALLSKVVAADGKEREMFCIPFGYVFGWLLTINPGNVNEASREGLMKYQAECYRVLLKHFTEQADFLEWKNKAVGEQEIIVDDLEEDCRLAKSALSDAKTKLKKLRTYTFEDYDMKRRQLELVF